MSLNEPIIRPSLGPKVLNGKYNLSYDTPGSTVHAGSMDARTTVSAFKNKFINTVAEARNRAGYTQAQMAELLEIGQGTYKTYEEDTFLPHRHMRKFCLLTGLKYSDLLDLVVGSTEIPQKRAQKNRGTGAK